MIQNLRTQLTRNTGNIMTDEVAARLLQVFNTEILPFISEAEEQ